MGDYKVIESRKITDDEYNVVINLLDKYKLDKSNFVNNCKNLVLNKIDDERYLYNGYIPEDNVILYNDKSNIVRELFHVASSTRSIYQGICIKPNKVFPESLGRSLNEGIADMFLELYNKEEGIFPFEKICAKLLKHVYTIKMFNFYFMNNDGGFRHCFDKDVASFLITLDEYSKKMIYVRSIYQHGDEVNEMLKRSIKVLMTDAIDELLTLIGNTDEKNVTYLFNQLNSKTMKPIYDIIGEYNYNNYH